MIHTLEVDNSSSVAELKKLFRKKLMTGGAVVRLRAGLTAEDLEQIRVTFEPGVEPHSLQEMVLVELVKAECLSERSRQQLCELPLPALQRLRGISC